MAPFRKPLSKLAILNTSTESLWKLLAKIDETTKALETYNRLKDYERDKFEKANALITEMQTLTSRFGQEKYAFYA